MPQPRVCRLLHFAFHSQLLWCWEYYPQRVELWTFISNPDDTQVLTLLIFYIRIGDLFFSPKCFLFLLFEMKLKGPLLDSLCQLTWLFKNLKQFHFYIFMRDKDYLVSGCRSDGQSDRQTSALSCIVWSKTEWFLTALDCVLASFIMLLTWLPSAWLLL